MSNLTEAMAKIVDVLSPLASEERLRVVRASMVLLGEELPNAAKKSAVNNADTKDDDCSDGLEMHASAQKWISKNGISAEQLEHYFHFDQGKVLPIALPGNATSKKEQTVNAYLVQGFSSFLATGDANFSDAEARSFCEKSGCYDVSNHGATLKALKNRVTGSKSLGWKLTTPGLIAVAELIKSSKA